MPIGTPSTLPVRPVLDAGLPCLERGVPPSLAGGRAVEGWLPSPGRAARGATSQW